MGEVIKFPFYRGHGPFDLGDGFSFRFTSWSPDREIPANNEKFQDVPDIERFGLILTCKHGREGSLIFYHGEPYDSMKFGGDHDRWNVLQAEPLTLDPSVQTGCCHGHIVDGKWVPC